MNHHPILILTIVLNCLSLTACLSAVSPCLSLPVFLSVSLFLFISLSLSLSPSVSVSLSLSLIILHSSFCLSRSLSLVVITLLSVHVDNLPPVSLVKEEHQLKLEKEEDSKQMYHIKKRN